MDSDDNDDDTSGQYTYIMIFFCCCEYYLFDGKLNCDDEQKIFDILYECAFILLYKCSNIGMFSWRKQSN